ncbi:MAG: radical SAM protein, partial [Planctomycetes bacterium]|nr:radical SAM protein [Planctomycetota bacterium]
MPKERILAECHGKVDGFHEPDRRCPVKKAIIANLDAVRTLEDGPVWYDEESLGVGNLQISSGCPCFCSFCEESWTQKPYRERSLPKLLAAAEAAKARQGLEEINLFSFNFNFHSDLYRLTFELSRRVGRVGFKSQRFDLLSQDPRLMAVERRIGKLSLTCGMEGISERLRRYLHKNLTERQVLDSCKAIFAAHARELKIFLIATGLEEDDDLEEFDAFVSKLLDLKRVRSPGTRLIFSLASLFNPPHTPLQFAPCPAADLDNLERCLRAIERVCSVHKVEHRRSGEPHETWLMQLLALADPRLTPALVRSSCEARFIFYGSVPPEVCDQWRGYLRDLNLSESDFFAAKPADAVFPWDDIDVGVRKQFLWEEYERARHFEEEDYCLGQPNRAGRCLACGGCPDETHIRHLTGHRATPPFIMDDLDAVLDRRKNPQTIRVLVRVEPEGRLLPTKFVATALARALMLAVPELTLPFLSHAGNLLDRSPKGWLEAPLFGLNAFDLAFVRPSPLDQLPAKLDLINAHCRDFKALHIQLDPPPLVEPHYALLRIALGAKPPLETILRSSGATYATRTSDGDRVFRVSAKS